MEANSSCGYIDGYIPRELWVHYLEVASMRLTDIQIKRIKPMSNNTILKALERMGYKGRMTGHGFRGLASTILHEQGYIHDHIELQLAHAPRNEVSAAYNHALYLEPRTRMMQDWADFLERTQRGGKVLPFRGTAA